MQKILLVVVIIEISVGTTAFIYLFSTRIIDLNLFDTRIHKNYNLNLFGTKIYKKCLINAKDFTGSGYYRNWCGYHCPN